MKSIFKTIYRRTKAELKYLLNIRYIYLTFDDGPSRGSTACFASCLENDIDASFFWVGKKYQNLTHTSTKEFLETRRKHFLICNHSFSHADNNYRDFYNDSNGVVNDFKKNAETLQLTNGIGRLPGMNAWNTHTINSVPIKLEVCGQKLKESGFLLFGWDIEWEFSKANTSNLAYNSKAMFGLIQNKMRKGFTKKQNHIVLLLHDWNFANSNCKYELNEFIKTAKNRGFRFGSLDKYPS